MKIVLDHVTKEFDHNVIIDDVDITLEKDHIYGFVGRNGSGKSVLFKLICGFYKPTKGKVLINNVDLNEKDVFPESTRVLIEKPNFLSDISGIENLRMLAAIQHKIGEKEIRETLELVNLEEADWKKKFHKYSLGMKQKLGIAQVLMENPNIMIFDEPFNGIDMKSTKKIKELIGNNKKDKIILITSHIKEDIISLADQIYLFDDGNIHPITPEDIEEYEHE